MSRVLVVAPSWVGDSVLAGALIERIAASLPGIAIDVLSPPWCSAVFERMPHVAAVVPSPFRHGELRLRERWQLARELASRGYLRAWILPNSLKSALVPWLARIPRRTGYLGEQRYGLVNDRRRVDPVAVPRLVDRFLRLAGDAGAPAGPDPPPVQPRLVADPRGREAACRKYGLAPVSPLLALCPGAEFGPAKRWPAAHYASLARDYRRRGYAVWIFGSPNDREVAAAIAAQVDGAIDLAGRTTLGEAIDLLSYPDLVITNDSGLMHVAAALDRPLVAVYGSSSPAYTPPLARRARIATLSLSCSPCFRRECPLGHLDCLQRLAPAQVIALAPEPDPTAARSHD